MLSVQNRVLFAASISVLVVAGCDLPTPEERRKNMHLPDINYKATSAQGKVVFERYCIECHGQNANGSSKGPPLVHDIYRPTHHANMAFHFAVKDGVASHHWNFGPMPRIKDITPEEVEDIIVYVRQLQRKSNIR